MRWTSVTCATVTLVGLLGLSGCGQGYGGHDAAHAEDDAHANGGHAAADHEAHDEVIRLTREQLEQAGVEIRPLGGGMIATHVTLPAEVGLNMDTVVHVTPRVAGIVREVRGYMGDEVATGTVLAVIESPGLGEAKIACLQATQAKLVAEAALERQRTISENTARLLAILRGQPTLESLRAASSALRIGENKARLLSAYARMKAAEANDARERELHAKNLSTESDLLAVREEYHSSMADYFAAFEEIEFTNALKLQEAERAAEIAASEVENAERRLSLLGFTESEIDRISEEPKDDLARYELRAPGGGLIVEKHITPGEKVRDDQSVYTIANLETVWFNISVYTEYAQQIREGQRVVVYAGDRSAAGVVDYVSAVVSEGTRTLSARVVVQNDDRSWKPGEFVIARVEIGSTPVRRLVPLEAVQTYEGRPVVFVEGEDGIEPVPVRLGLQNGETVELVGDDIALGTSVVVKNSFLMKAELGKRAAGHEH